MLRKRIKKQSTQAISVLTLAVAALGVTGTSLAAERPHAAFRA